MEEKTEDTEDPEGMVLITTSALPQTEALLKAIETYRETIEVTEGLTSEYVVLDSDKCLSKYGVKLQDIFSWKETRNHIRVVRQKLNAKYVLILGGSATVAMPQYEVDAFGYEICFNSDTRYSDENGDKIPDEGLVIARMPNIQGDVTAIITMLQAAINLHNSGGHTIEGGEVLIGDGAHPSPPYCIDGTVCNKDKVIDLLNNSDLLAFAGHGTPCDMKDKDKNNMLLFVCEGPYADDLINLFKLTAHHPIIANFTICGTGALPLLTLVTPIEEPISFAHVFMKEGAGAFIGKVSNIPWTEEINIESNFYTFFLEKRKPIGDALYEAILIDAANPYNLNSIIQYNLYGDPTLRRIRK